MARKRRERAPTMNDVAERAGVSQTTVSFVLNEVTTVTLPDETRERVLQAARDLGYRPNAAAKVLRTSKSHMVGFLTDEIATSPYAGKVIKGAQDIALAEDKLLLIINTGGHRPTEEKAIERMLEWQVEGIIYAVGFHRAIDLPQTIHEVPAIVVNGFAADHSLSSVVPDEVGGGYEATMTLARAGHQRIAFINLNSLASGLPAVLGRLEGYRNALADQGLPWDESIVFCDGLGNADDGYEHAHELMRLAVPPTAIFCSTDRVAVGVYEALKELGRAVPGDVAVIGFDNQEHIAAHLSPPLSTMELPFYEMGRWAASQLIHQSAEAPLTHKILPCPYIARASV